MSTNNGYKGYDIRPAQIAPRDRVYVLPVGSACPEHDAAHFVSFAAAKAAIDAGNPDPGTRDRDRGIVSATAEQIANLVYRAAACAGERRVSRALENAIKTCNHDLAADAAEARIADMRAARIVIGHGAPPPATAADRVWCWLDREHGPAITRAMSSR